LKIGEAKTTNGGNLKCKIIHTVPPTLEDDEKEISPELVQAFNICLDEANRNGNVTLLLPLIGASYGYSHDLWWRAASQAFKDFSKRYPNPKLKNVTIINHDKETIEGLKDIRNKQVARD